MQNLVKPLITIIGNIQNHFKPDFKKTSKKSEMAEKSVGKSKQQKKPV